ncbi:MAG: bacteriohemerythrin [Opitutaceae bacterium]|nr:bacteriohemerythrin [Opitutaceae bacterium]
MLQWSSQYETGVTLVDTQHKVLFEHINRLEEMTKRAEIPAQELHRLLSFLETYVASHFKFEEQCMHRYHCPSHEANARAHQQFLQAFALLKDEYARVGATHAFVGKLFNAARDWIHSHILKVDMSLKSASRVVG